MQSFTAVIENEGTEYARIAENLLKGDGYIGKRDEGPQLMFPPLYPFLIAAFSFVVGELDLAGRSVSVLFGTLLVAVIFLIAQRIHGRRIAWIAASLATLHPWMIGMSATVYSESTYLTLVMAGVYWALCSLDFPSLRRAALSGACFGLAYLTRPEAFIFPFVVVAFIVAINRRMLRRAARYSGVLVGAFTIVAVPYIAFISYHAGHLRIEGKSPINYQIGQRMLTGMTYIAAGYEVKDDLTPAGVFVRSDLSVVRSNRFDLSEMVQYLFASAKGNGILALRMVTRAPSFGAPLLGALIVIGFFRRSWSRARAVQEALLLSVVVGVLLAILSVQFFYMRFLYALLPVLIVWGARGIGEVASWTQGTLSGIGWIGRQQRGFRTAVAWGLMSLAE
jgi:4-amino-4-deoxy-L-arabinose transferase-like glycosyltransferase